MKVYAKKTHAGKRHAASGVSSNGTAARDTLNAPLKNTGAFTSQRAMFPSKIQQGSFSPLAPDSGLDAFRYGHPGIYPENPVSRKNTAFSPDGFGKTRSVQREQTLFFGVGSPGAQTGQLKLRESSTLFPGKKGSTFAVGAVNQILDRTLPPTPGETPREIERHPQPEKMNPGGLPIELKRNMEALSGLSLAAVRVHYNSSKPAQLQAFAFTQGTDIHLAPGREQHLPHESWHTIQQMKGRVKPTIQTSDMSINTDAALESEADIMSAKALNTPAPVISPPLDSAALSVASSPSAPIQCAGGKQREIVRAIVDKNIKGNVNGWFTLSEKMLDSYADKVFHLMENIRHTDLTTLMIAHQQVNDESTATQDEKIDTLSKHHETVKKEIQSLKDYDLEAITAKLTELNKQLESSKIQKTGGRRIANRKKQGMKPGTLKLLQERKTYEDKLRWLKQLESTGKGNPEDLRKLSRLKSSKTYQEQLHRELKIQKALKGKKGMNIEFLNTTDIGEGRNVIRAYMSIVAPSFDDKFKDFYLKDKNQLTYSAKDKVMWVSFGTPLRSLSWFQKYALENKGDNVPLIRSFLLPMSFFEKHSPESVTEAPDMSKGKTLKQTSLTARSEDFYGSSIPSKKYSSKIRMIDPYLMNVDVKYPNQFGVGRIKFSEEEPESPDFFKNTKEEFGKKELAHKQIPFDEKLKSLDEQLTQTQKEISEIDEMDIELGEVKIDESVNLLLVANQDFDPETVKSYGARNYLMAVKEGESHPVANLSNKIVGYKILMGLAKEKIKDDLSKQIKLQKQAKELSEASFKDISGGDSKLKSEIAKKTSELEESYKQQDSEPSSSLMSNLLKSAIKGSFKTIALASDRKYEHIASREGEMEDISSFIKNLGLSFGQDKPMAHLLDEKFTAFHNLGVDQSWGSQTPSQTAEIYTKMRFFFHQLDNQTSETEEKPMVMPKEPVDWSKLDITKDSDLHKVIGQIKSNPDVDPKVKELAGKYLAVNVTDQLSFILNGNHLTPADVFGLPANMDNGRKDRHGNTIVNTAFETFFAEETILSPSSAGFISDNVQKIMDAITTGGQAQKLLKDILENSYLKRDIQEISANGAEKEFGVQRNIPVDQKEVLKVLDKLKNIQKEKNRHRQLRMVYLFFHILRPWAKIMGDADGGKNKKAPLTDAPVGDLEVNNREDLLSHFDILNPQMKPFGVMDTTLKPGDENGDMPYDKFRSAFKYKPDEGKKMTGIMKELDMPFVGGVSGTTRDQSQVLESMFSKPVLEQKYWDFQLMNAAFMIANGYHSFFESLYVAARFDHYTDKGGKVLTKFNELRSNKKQGLEVYTEILDIIGADKKLINDFNKWYEKHKLEMGAPEADLEYPGAGKSDMPFSEIIYPKEDEELTAPDYTLRIHANHATNNILVKILTQEKDAAWLQARQTKEGTWWYDWKGIQPGAYEVMAQAWSQNGKEFVSKHVRVLKK